MPGVDPTGGSYCHTGAALVVKQAIVDMAFLQEWDSSGGQGLDRAIRSVASKLPEVGICGHSDNVLGQQPAGLQ